MINKNKMFMFISILCVAMIEVNLFACMTTFINDSNDRVALLNELDQSFIVIPKHGKRRFGDHQKHANFVVYTMRHEKSQLWSPVYTCQQNECGSKGNIELKFSDVENCADVTKSFTIIKHKPYTSMVHTLPMIQKKSCHCNCINKN
jgi:hypothetical protein